LLETMQVGIKFTIVSHVISRRGHVRKRPWPEVCSAHAWFIPPIFS
jgi:hypothetical protein